MNKKQVKILGVVGLCTIVLICVTLPAIINYMSSGRSRAESLVFNEIIITVCFVFILATAGFAYYKISHSKEKLQAHTAIYRVTEELQRISTEREEISEKISEQELLFQNILSNVPARIFWKDKNSVYQGCNANFANDVGLRSPQDIIGKTDYDLIWKKEKADFFVKCDSDIMRSGISLLNMEEQQQQADGRMANILASKIPLRDAYGNVYGILGIYSDITELKAAREKINSEPLKGDGTASMQAGKESGTKDQRPKTKARETEKQARVLIVDDVEENRMLIEVMLRKSNYKMSFCTNGKEAVELASTEKFDLILMDIQMPVMDGLEAIKIIKSRGPNSKTPIAAITAATSKEEELSYLDAGCDDVILKPIDKAVLIRKADRLIQKTEQIKIADQGGDIKSFLADNPDYHKMIKMFVRNLPERIKEMQDALDERNLQDLAFKIHALKGLGGFAGFPVYTEKAKVIEQMIHDNQMENIQEQLNEMVRLCQRTKTTRREDKS